ncbi:DUF3090 family protein, partial [Corynebacterium dentalis]|uniref:DUF3090 family protein n=1 Tax=Corynebacterium dentalis TaxID=2014528 RepID=UPI0035E3E8A5
MNSTASPSPSCTSSSSTDRPCEDWTGKNYADEWLVPMPVGTARAFAKRTREIVGAGRPICVICGQPIDADGHT